jgi:hypothetical protein
MVQNIFAVYSPDGPCTSARSSTSPLHFHDFVYPPCGDIESPERFSQQPHFVRALRASAVSESILQMHPPPYPALRRSRSSPPRQSVGPLLSDTAALNCSAPLIG